MRNLSHKLHILKTLLESDVKLTATNFSYISNANQYFCDLKNNGIELIERRVKNKQNNGYHLERSLKRTPENIEKAQKLLEKLRGKNATSKSPN